MNKTKSICPNCGTLVLEEDFPSFQYTTLIECPECAKKVKPLLVKKKIKLNNIAKDEL